MKICKYCGIEKELEDFAVSSSCKDGRRNCCLICWKLKRSKHYQKNKILIEEKRRTPEGKEKNRKNAKNTYYRHKEIINAKQRIKYYERTEEERKASLERSREFRKTEKAKLWQKEYKLKETKRFSAMTILNNAVRDGKLKKSENCLFCSSKENIEGHHPDYDKPLYVLWVCRKCHSTLHQYLKEG